LSKVLGLNATQESSLGLVFHYADKNGLALLDLKDLQAVVAHLVSDEGKGDLKGVGGLAASTAGVILRQLIAFADQGAQDFFGEPEFDTDDLIRIADDGRGVITCLELPGVRDKPVVFSTFLMWLLAELFFPRWETRTSPRWCSSSTRRTCCSTTRPRRSWTRSSRRSG
jgi:DNA helicase HerA-like ATPase